MFSESLKEDLYHCLKCGMCQQNCPTFRATRREYFAPRGRVQIIKHYVEGDMLLSPAFRDAIMSCTLCDACAATCPSGVRIDHVFRTMRSELAQASGPGLAKRALFSILRNRSLMRTGAAVGHAGQKLIVGQEWPPWRIGNIPLSRFPRLTARPFGKTIGERVPARGKRVGRVLYFTGCATELFNENVGKAVVTVLSSLGFEVIVPADQVCCGAPVFLAGFVQESAPNIRTNLRVLDRESFDAIVVDCATCGAALKKEIPRVVEELGHDPSAALRVAGKVRDVSQIVAERIGTLPSARRRGSRITVTYHDPCHLARGMRVTKEPRTILDSLPNVRLVEMSDAGACCGGAGSYQFENVDLSHRITSRKIEIVEETGASVVATGCPGCQLTLACNLEPSRGIEVIHTVQLLARSLFGV